MGKTIADVSKDLANAVSAGRAEIDRYRQANAAKRREREETDNAVVPLTEVDARIDRYVDELAAHWLQQHAISVTSGPFGFARAKTNDGNGFLGRLDMASFEARAAMDPDSTKTQLKRFVRLGIKQLGLTTGLPTKDRPAVLARLDVAIAALEVDEEAAIDALIAAGVQGVEHRLEVVNRRRRLAEFNKNRDQRRAGLEDVARKNRDLYRGYQQDVPAGTIGCPGWSVDEHIAAQEREILGGGPVHGVAQSAANESGTPVTQAASPRFD